MNVNKKMLYKKQYTQKGHQYYSFSLNFQRSNNPILALNDLFDYLWKRDALKSAITQYMEDHPAEKELIIKLLEEVQGIKAQWNGNGNTGGAQE